MIIDIIRIHAKDELSTIESLGALYGLAITAFYKSGSSADWVDIVDQIILERFGGAGSANAWFMVSQVKERGQALNEAMLFQFIDEGRYEGKEA